MSRNPISFIFHLGKHYPLKLRPLPQLSVEVEMPSPLLLNTLITRKPRLHIDQVQHSNQMSS